MMQQHLMQQQLMMQQQHMQQNVFTNVPSAMQRVTLVSPSLGFDCVPMWTGTASDQLTAAMPADRSFSLLRLLLTI